MNLPNPGAISTATAIQQNRLPRQVGPPKPGAMLGFLHKLRGLQRSQRPALFRNELPAVPKQKRLTAGPEPLSGLGVKGTGQI